MMQLRSEQSELPAPQARASAPLRVSRDWHWHSLAAHLIEVLRPDRTQGDHRANTATLNLRIAPAGSLRNRYEGGRDAARNNFPALLSSRLMRERRDA